MYRRFNQYKLGPAASWRAGCVLSRRRALVTFCRFVQPGGAALLSYVASCRLAMSGYITPPCSVLHDSAAVFVSRIVLPLRIVRLVFNIAAV